MEVGGPTFWWHGGGADSGGSQFVFCDGHVIFLPAANFTKNETYTLKLYNETDPNQNQKESGAKSPYSKRRVLFSSDARSADISWLWPEPPGNRVVTIDSGLTAEVTSGDNVIDFELPKK